MPIDTSVKNVERLVEIHVNRYANRVRLAKSGGRGYNLGECERYLAIWQSVEQAGCDFSKCSKAAQNEICDAIPRTSRGKTMALGHTNIPYLTRLYHPTTGCSGTGCAARCWARDLVRNRLAGTMRGLPEHCQHLIGTRCEGQGTCAGEKGVCNGWVEADPFAPTFHADRLADPLRARKPQVIGVSFLGDLFDAAITDEQIAAVFGVMAACPQHTFIVLTKQAARLEAWHTWLDRTQDAGHWTECHWHAMREDTDAGYVETHGDEGPSGRPWPLPNIWTGVSVSTQPDADARIPHLLRTPAAHRWVSVEPMLEGIDLTHLRHARAGLDALRAGSWSPAGKFVGRGDISALDFVLAGGESGPGARPCDLDWLRSVARQCRAAGVHCWVKQVGSNPGDTTTQERWGGSLPRGMFGYGRAGEDAAGWPADLREMRGSVPWLVHP
jgi:protein gp37